MKIRISVIWGLMIPSFIFVSAAKADGFKEGQWKMTMVTHMDNMSPEMAQAMQQMQNMPPEAQAMMKARGISMGANGQGMTMTITQCMTKENPVPKHSHETEDHCKTTHEMDGNTVKFSSTCDFNDMKMDSSGEMTYTGDTMQGHIKSHQVRGGGSLRIQALISMGSM